MKGEGSKVGRSGWARFSRARPSATVVSILTKLATSGSS